jgi:hypothetical protein
VPVTYRLLRRCNFSGAVCLSSRFSILAFDRPHEITDRVDLIGDDVCHLEARDLILNRDHYFEAIKPVGSQIVAEARLGSTPRWAAMILRLDVDVALHGRSPL